ncbi:MAG: molybdopterin cofactor-binding domain-containing protein, partial [Candidatus Acidiferrales bacterium]
MSTVISPPRREFMKKSALASAGLVIGFHLPEAWPRDVGQTPATAAPFAPNAFVRIAPSGRVTVMVGKAEMGQGVYTSLPMILAEELDADWNKVGFEAAPADPAFNHTVFGMQMTGGSTSVWSSFDQLRQAGAMARAMLVNAAAEEWKVDAATCRTEKGFVFHDATKRRLSYGALATKAAALPVPTQVAGAAGVAPPGDVKLKDPKDFKLIGKPTRRLDTPEKTNGAAVFGIDVKRPGMLTAVVARPPVFGGKARSFSAEKTKAIKGVKTVVEIPRGVAVIADGFWAAKRGRDALKVQWDEGPLANFSTERQRSEFAALAKTPGTVARKDGDAQAALQSAAKRIEAEYEVPYLAHATMEPMNCVADVRADACEVWI